MKKVMHSTDKLCFRGRGSWKTGRWSRSILAIVVVFTVLALGVTAVSAQSTLANWEQVINPLGTGFESTWQGGWVIICTENTVYCPANACNPIYTRTRTPPYSNDVDWARWRPTLPTTDQYDVYVYIPDYTHTMNITEQARYQVTHANGQATVIVNQNNNKCSWTHLGRYWFNAGTSGNVYLGDWTGDDPVRLIAVDAAKFVRVEPLPASPALDPIRNPDSDGSFGIDWNDASNASSYVLEEDDNSIFSSPTVRYNSTDSSYQMQDQDSGDWHYRVKALNAWGASPWSNIKSVIVQSFQPTGGSGFFVDSAQDLGDRPSHHVATGDLDGDGDLDAVTGNWDVPNEVWLNDGSGWFTDSGQRLGGNEPTEYVALGDLDSDGDLDIYVANGYGANYDNVWINDGHGNFSDSGQSLGPTASKGVSLGDLDGDGDLDAFVVNWNDANWVHFNDGTGHFSDSGQRLGGSWHSWGVGLGDLDGDGDLDALDASTQGSRVWINDGHGFFTDSGQSTGAQEGNGVALGDLDNDHDLDAVITHGGNEPAQVWFNNGSAVFEKSNQSLHTSDSLAVALGDLDADGDLDVFIGNGWDTGDTVWLNDGSGYFTDTGQSLGNFESFSVALSDLDGDGDLDAFVSTALGQPNKVWFNSNHTLFLPHNLHARAGLDSVLLTWDPSSSVGVTGYHVYRKTVGDTDFIRLTSTPVSVLSYRDDTVVRDTTYVYYVTAVTNSGEESAPSEQVEITFGSMSLNIPVVHTSPGDTIQVPVNVENADGLCMAAMDIGILFDAQVAQVTGVERTALTANYAFEHTMRSEDEVHISSMGTCDELYGPGSLFLVEFQVNPDATVNSSLDFVRGLTGTVVYDDGDLFHPVPLSLIDGQLSLDGQYIRGDINGDGVVNAADAAIALKIAAGEIIPTPLQLLAGDVNGDGVVNAADASMILYYAAHQQWPPVGGLSRGTVDSGAQTVSLTPGTVVCARGAEVEVPIRVDDSTAVAGSTLVVHYGNGLEYLGARLDGDLESSNYRMETYDPMLGHVRISLAGRNSLTGGTRDLVWLRFRVGEGAEEIDTWVRTAGAWLNDLVGRDFAISVLQKEVVGGEGGVHFGYRIFLPVTMRR